jgi:hypothetical protein
MNRIRIAGRGPGANAVARALPAGPARPGHRPGQEHSRGPRIPERHPGHDGLGRPAPTVGCPDGDPRGQDGPPRPGVHVGMHAAHQRGGAANRGRRAGFRRWAVTGSPAATCRPRTRAKQGGNPGWRGPGSRPRHRQQIGQEHPGPPDRPSRGPGVMRAQRRPAGVRSSLSGKSTRARHPQPAQRRVARQQAAERTRPERILTRCGMTQWSPTW